jgi:hypothetical protein
MQEPPLKMGVGVLFREMVKVVPGAVARGFWRRRMRRRRRRRRRRRVRVSKATGEEEGEDGEEDGEGEGEKREAVMV